MIKDHEEKFAKTFENPVNSRRILSFEFKLSTKNVLTHKKGVLIFRVHSFVPRELVEECVV